jgi:hypothetical protein
MFWVRPRANPKGELLIGAPLGSAPAFPANITLDWKGLPVTNRIVFLQAFVNYGRKKFYNNGPCTINILQTSYDDFHDT